MQDPMMEIFIFESEQLLETLEDVLLQGEREQVLNEDQIDEVFRIMHTIKGSASMMSLDELSHVAHAVEDLFSYLRENTVASAAWNGIFDIVLLVNDFLKDGVAMLLNGAVPSASAESESLKQKIHNFINALRGDPTGDTADYEGVALSFGTAQGDNDDIAPYYKIRVAFEPDSQMENMRAFGVVNAVAPKCLKLAHIPEDLTKSDAAEDIINNGFIMYIQSNENPDNIKLIIEEVMFLQSCSLIALSEDNEDIPVSIRPEPKTVSDQKNDEETAVRTVSESRQNFISVNVNKLDKLMDLVGEIVTSESMVTRNPDIINLQIEGFEKAASELRKHVSDLQEIVMSIRMLPVSTTFHKMQRVVRDMSKKINKEVDLVIIGEETEVDKSIIDSLSDPLMHLIRNAVEHGIEMPEERVAVGKPSVGTVTLEARNTGGDVMILVTDDGGGLDRNAIIKKATEKGLLNKPESEISDKEAFNLILAPGFSTNKQVTEYSGRGVGMDVVRRNIESVNGTIAIESEKGKGSSFILRIPLTLAIIEGMKLRVGKSLFIVPMLSISESFKPNMDDVFLDPDGREQIMIRGECYPILRLHRMFDIVPEVENLADGILIMMSAENNSYCLFVDQLIGEQQAVIKPLPLYIQKHNNNMHGIGGCAILGDGSISLIIDINNLVV